jgi:hypothetical protein
MSPEAGKSGFSGTATACGGALSILLIALIRALGFEPTPNVAGAIATVCIYICNLLEVRFFKGKG